LQTPIFHFLQLQLSFIDDDLNFPFIHDLIGAVHNIPVPIRLSIGFGSHPVHKNKITN